MSSRKIKTLLFSTLYPSSARPTHGIFVETRLRELLRTGEVDTRVIAPVPWFFSTDDRYGAYAQMARTPAEESRGGVQILHPRYPVVPKFGMTIAPLLLALAAAGSVRRLIQGGFDFDLIDAHYYYPDGVAAALLARHFGKPFAITARGTDLNLIPRHRLPRLMMNWAARRANASIGVCSALVDVLRGWGIDPSRLHVMRNGVDLARFRPLPQAAARRELAIDGLPVLLSVGHLVERKGHHVAIDALAALLPQRPDARLIIIGEGEERSSLAARARRLGIESRVTLTGAIDNQRLAHWYSAADVLILASSREGWANVLLEAMACGTPVVATRIWGTPEVVTSDAVGLLVDRRDGADIAAAVNRLLDATPDRAAVRSYAEGFGWDSTSRSQLALFNQMVAAPLQCAAA